MGTHTLCPGDWWIRAGDLTSPDMGDVYSNDLWCGFRTAPLVLAGVLHSVSGIADFVLYHVVTSVSFGVTAETDR